MAALEIKTADELMTWDTSARREDRRRDRQTAMMQTVYRLFLERGGPLPIPDIIAAFGDGRTYAARRALEALHEDDLLRIRDDAVDIAYPFAASPTPFTVRLRARHSTATDRQVPRHLTAMDRQVHRYACCAMDALGMAPMFGQAIAIDTRCHHCDEPLALTATPEGAGPEAREMMLWFGLRGDERNKVADTW
jgi:hypothetical protein